MGQELAINPGIVHGTLNGKATKEPAFGLEAVWIDPSQRDYARTLGYTVVDASTAIATHMNAILRENSASLLSHDETQQLLDKVAERSPKLVEDLVPNKLPLATVTKILQNVLAEDVSVRDMRSIIDVLTIESGRTQDPEELTALVRPRLGRMIMQSLINVDENLPVMTLEPSLEQMLTTILTQSKRNGSLVIEPKLAEDLFAAIANSCQQVEEQGLPTVLVVSPGLRPWLSRTARQRVPRLTVLSYSEIPDDQDIKIISNISIRETKGETA